MGAVEASEAVDRLEAEAASLLPAPESDLLAWAAHVLGRGMEGCSERYGRAVVGRGESRDGALVHCVERRWLDGLGRLTRVSVVRELLSSIVRKRTCDFALESACASSFELYLQGQAPARHPEF